MASFFSRAMSLVFLTFLFNIAFFSSHVAALGKTDTITWGGDVSRAGYQNNHNMDPAIVGSSQFGLLYRTRLPGAYNGAAEQIYSQPLVYTSSDGVQYVFVATTQNNVYKINAKTGVIVLQRNLHVPFLTADLDGCVDINPLIGVTATGVIDPATDVWYLTAKTYVDQSPTGAKGRPNGRYYIHAIDTNTLAEKPNFPVDLEGMVARNNPVRSFNGGIHHQRPALLQAGQYIYAGFASHCVQYNFTGWIVGWDKTSGALVERFATEGAGVGPTVPGAGVWMSGGGLASDGKGSMFFATGNGYASQLSNVPVSGRNPPTALEEAAVHMTINGDGSLTVVDFFMPWEKQALDGADKDLGTSPLEILPSQFSCGVYQRIGVITGKSGKTYWINLDDMGGYQNGPDKLDDVIQVFQNENSVYAGAGVYPLEGGYIYINVIQYKTHVFKFSCSNGIPSFTQVADSPEKNAYILGVGHGTVTSLDDQPGTGLVWTSDVEGANLRIYDAVPQQGVLRLINSFVTPGVTKFTRPVFGDGIAYQGTTQGYLYAYGAPVNLPLECSGPYDFGVASLNTTSATRAVQCQAKTALTVSAIALSGNNNFVLSGLPTLPLQVAAGTNFTFNAAFAPKQIGSLQSDVVVNTTQAAAGYSINTAIRLKGVAESTAPVLSITPNVLSFDGTIVGQSVGGVNKTVIWSNLGNGPLTVSGIQYSLVSETGPWVAPNSTGDGKTVISAFTIFGEPSSIAGKTDTPVTVNFNPPTSGGYAVYMKVSSDGGSKVYDIIGTGADYPMALLEFEKPDGSGWVEYDNSTAFTFGSVTQNTVRYLKMRLSNVGTGNAARLSVTVSKPPFGVPGIIGANNQMDLGEGSTIGPGQSAIATLYCAPPKSQVNVDAYNGTAEWTMNLGDPAFGKQVIKFFCNAVSEQYPPLDSAQQGLYRYYGCFKENNPGRQLQTQIYGSPDNTNGKCMAACSAAGYIFAATQYNSECWCGNYRPKQLVDEKNCNFACSGKVTEVCGGNGITEDGSFLSLFGDRTRFDGNLTKDVGPFVNPGVLGFTSQGCYTEATTGRALARGVNPVPVTIAGCISACKSGGDSLAGMEYGGECYCGNSLAAGSVPAPAGDCNMVCRDNGTEFCGGGSRLNIYKLDTSASDPVNGTGTSSSPTPTPTGPTIRRNAGNFTYQMCATEVPGRALNGKAVASDDMTVARCAGNCTDYTYMAVEYARECFCGNTLAAGSVAATDGRCNMVCAGNTTEYCGGPNGLSLYKYEAPLASIVNSSTFSENSTVSSTMSATSSTSSPSSSTSSTNSTSWTYSGCANETTGRALSGASTASADMTPQKCQTFCLSKNLPMAGLEYSTECFCGTDLGPGSTYNQTGCSMPCGGDKTQTCGGPNRLDVYEYPGYVKPSHPRKVGLYDFLGCYAEPATGGRALSGYSFVNATDMSAEFCVSGCAARNYTYAGAEYAKECWCGNELKSSATLLEEQKCDMLCAGNRNEYCGAGSRLSVWKSR
ncbi:hypothetical protein EPUS_02114 [Endocarpon pusillum Z07020]|uniref:WSC domain-containing protein n=1 Tax=Endocarpon pusillum (strain Z07020 / HMAS-L-300199) TaxID=1263415 RepID=U1G4J3_ENDPU|nr:uncharacterized protein EPUS_02114 [Endocarpon pusillum Z07020]ERF72227.1 hypothetical protein EPUS_02114 [Endocarpon pusillum Z07020]